MSLTVKDSGLPCRRCSCRRLLNVLPAFNVTSWSSNVISAVSLSRASRSNSIARRIHLAVELSSAALDPIGSSSTCRPLGTSALSVVRDLQSLGSSSSDTRTILIVVRKLRWQIADDDPHRARFKCVVVRQQRGRLQVGFQLGLPLDIDEKLQRAAAFDVAELLFGLHQHRVDRLADGKLFPLYLERLP